MAPRISPQKTSFLSWAMIVLSSLFLAWQPSAVHAGNYIRVKKNGVVYYYFSTREGKVANPSAAGSGRVRAVPPPSLKKVSAQELEPLIHGAGSQHNLPPSLIKAVIRVESNFNPAATSPKGAQGLMQLMPKTAGELQVANPYDPRENIGAGARYLSMLLGKFNNCLPLALAAYNAGPHRVDQHRQVPPIMETQEFVRDVCTHFLKYNKERTASP